MSIHDEGWSDFTHTTRTSKASAQELFERYREFQSFIAGFSRRELVARRWLKTVDDDSPLATVFFDLPLSKQPTLFRSWAVSRAGDRKRRSPAASHRPRSSASGGRPTLCGKTRL